MAMVKVYNKGTRPIVWNKSRTAGKQVLHPGKYDLFSEVKSKEIISKFENAISEEDWNTIQKEKAAEAAKSKKAEK